MLVVGLAGAAVNVGAAWALSRAERRSLNIEGARAHVLADLYGRWARRSPASSCSSRASSARTASSRCSWPR